MKARPENDYDIEAYKFWCKEIENANIWREDFLTRGATINERYRAENEDLSFTTSNYNILYSNTETILPVIYNDKPLPDVTATDTSVISYRKGAQLIEKAVNYYLDDEFNEKARLVTQDYLLAGLGQMRVKYRPLIEEIEKPKDIELNPEEIFEQVVFEELEYEYIAWDCFLYPRSDSWADVPWIAYKTYMSYEVAKDMFGEEKASMLSYDLYDKDNKKVKKNHITGDEYSKKACVYEIWDKDYKQQIFFSENKGNVILEINDDPLELECFFPSPKPLLSITTSGNLLPVPFFVMYQDQAQELNEVCARIASLVENMKRRGFYDAAMDELGNINDLDDNEFLPVKNWGEFLGKGGMAGAMQFEDVTSYASVLQILTLRKQELINDIYQIMGISDIQRAATDPRETLGAQKLKSRYGTIRISTYQRRVQEFFRDVIKISGEIIINQFQPETVALITNTPLVTEFETTPEGEKKVKEVGATELLEEIREKVPSAIAIDIQTDSTALEEAEDDKADMLDMARALAQMVQLAPSMDAVMGREATASMLLGFVQKYKMGRNIQQQVLDYIDALEKNPPQQQPSDAQIRMQEKQMEIQADLQKAQLKAMSEEKDRQIKLFELQLKAQEMNVKANIDYEALDIKAIEAAIKAAGLKVEAENPNDNAVVGA